MKAVVLPGDETTQVQTVADPTPGAGEVLIRVRASAICGSDMSAYRGDPVLAIPPGGVVPGHEVAGEIAELGSGVTGLAVGDRVAVYLAIGCMRCEACRRGYLMLCPNWQVIGFTRNGGDAEYITVPAVNCMPLPDEISFLEAAVATDMFGTQFSAQERLGVSATDSVLIFGLGPMGAAAVAIAKARGAHVIAVDPVESRRAAAERLGADTVAPSDDAEIARALASVGGGVDVAIECSGNAKALWAALDSVVPFGRMAIVGESRESRINPSDHFVRKLTTVIGAWYFPIWQFGPILDFLIGKQVPVDGIVSHRLTLDDAPEAFEMLRDRTAEKMVFEL
ncbi:MAG: alcohol dehydrogenase catalytic domain-containing protein [Solirubrobacterales bacterium]|nr:alcohol dehydrogenase catalytic domain-containing protein [Solirubrobacterales bacterium]